MILQVAPALLQHPSTSVRAAAVDFTAAAAHFLMPADVYAHLLPLVMPAVTTEPAALTSQAAIVQQLPQQLQQATLERTGLGSSASPSKALGSRQGPGSYTASDVSASSASSLKRAGASPLTGIHAIAATLLAFRMLVCCPYAMSCPLARRQQPARLQSQAYVKFNSSHAKLPYACCLHATQKWYWPCVWAHVALYRVRC